MVQNERLTPPYRLRDLDRSGKVWAGAFAVALLLAPIVTFLISLPKWAPGGDPAMMGLQSLAVGSDDTPLTGQPSTSALYVEGANRHVDHLGPVHLYLMAVPMRLLGPSAGMLSISLVVVSTCLLLMAWVTYRRLGPVGGMIGAVLLGIIMFTAGAGIMMNPVSSHFAGYPLYCSALLLWCVMRGDVRLLPLATAVTAFAAQQHLSVGPTVAVLVVAAVGGLLYHWGRDGRWREGPARRELLVWAGPAAAIGFVLWLPMLVQQLFGSPGNLAHLVRLAFNSERPTVGLGSAVSQVAHVLGLPPMLWNQDLRGVDLTLRPSALTWVSAGVVVAVLALLALRWRRESRERFFVVLMAGVLVIAGLVNGSSVLDSYEKWRLVLYHWVFPLSFFVLMALALGAIDLSRHVISKAGDRLPVLQSLGPRLPAFRPVLAGAALLAVAAPAVINPSLDRPSNSVYALSIPIERTYLEDLASQVLEHRDRFEEPLAILPRGQGTFGSLAEGLGLQLAYEEVDVRFSTNWRHYVPDDRLIDADHRTGALLLLHDTDLEWEEPGVGELIADVFTVEDVDFSAYDDLVRQLSEADQYRFSPSLRAEFNSLPEEMVDAAEQGDLLATIEDGQVVQHPRLTNPTAEQLEDFWVLGALNALHDEPHQSLTNANVLDLLLEHPLEEPELDPELLEALKDSDLHETFSNQALRLRVYLLDHEELLEIGLGEGVPAG